MMTPLQFVTKAIELNKAVNKAKGKEYKGLHSVFSQFNEEYRVIFGKPEMTPEQIKALPIDAMKALQDQGHIKLIPAFKGVNIYLAADAAGMKITPAVTKEKAMAKYGMTPPPVIAPKAKRQHAVVVEQPTAA